ncbi:hypothetical protein C5E16_01785 [Clavibacter michiganensis]|uniref:Uncharacterized protein n=1 Tax=Clavibacter michiganensis TaxID=28447 RepID=A0A2S5VXK1_9MICO|nr:hypothetical protein [Clavibacter michiganensis]PPF71004.1 hypothetical protein C5E16_01785 [Clavibacter michiganensis]
MASEQKRGKGPIVFAVGITVVLAAMAIWSFTSGQDMGEPFGNRRFLGLPQGVLLIGGVVIGVILTISAILKYRPRR